MRLALCAFGGTCMLKNSLKFSANEGANPRLWRMSTGSAQKARQRVNCHQPMFFALHSAGVTIEINGCVY